MRKQFLVAPEGDSRNPEGEGLELRHSGMSSGRLCCGLLVLSTVACWWRSKGRGAT